MKSEIMGVLSESISVIIPESLNHLRIVYKKNPDDSHPDFYEYSSLYKQQQPLQQWHITEALVRMFK